LALSPKPSFCREQLLALLAEYLPRGGEGVREISEQLGLREHRKFAAPDKILVILFASRSGSNYLGQLLSSTGWFREINESFRPSQLDKIRSRYALAGMHEAAQWMIDQRGTSQAFGFKAGFNVLVSAAELGFLHEVLERAHIVLLRRRDRLAQAVSIRKMNLTGRTHSGQPQDRILTEDDYDAAAIAFQMAKIDEVSNHLADLVQRLGKTATILHYEDICAQPEQHVATVCESMGLTMPVDYRPRVRVQVLCDDLSERWIERFRSENPGL
jgi:LPS sulfotransferase NodH